jgi:hypothetical protein
MVLSMIGLSCFAVVEGGAGFDSTTAGGLGSSFGTFGFSVDAFGDLGEPG